ncbi:MAG: lamin tail domain-containing protein [Phycisphaerales bacterium]
MDRSLVLASCLVLMIAACVPAQEGSPILLVINEVMASNSSTKADPQGQYDDWIEVYNYGSVSVDAGGLYLTDDPEKPAKWQIPTTDPILTTIAPGGYLLIWADGDTEAPGLHASFKLSAGGEELCLFDADGATPIDRMAFPELLTDISYGRSPDGGDDWRYFVDATPAEANQGGYEGLVGGIEFSQGRGFHREPFSLVLATDTPDATIYYTLDGELPGQTPPSSTTSGRPRSGQVETPALSGTLYTAPITIDKTTCLRAVAIRQGWKPSALYTQTYIFVSDVIKQSSTGGQPSANWPAPYAGGGGFPWGGGGAQVIDYGMDPDVVNDPRYKDLMKDALLSIPSLSLVTPLANLFNSTTGIYVNALQDGIAWERPVSMELIYPDGTPGFQIDAGLRIRGGYGRGGDNAKHAFRLFFRAEYGVSKLKYPLFGDEGVDEFDKVDLRTESNYSWAFKGSSGDDNGSKNTLLRDVFSRDLQGATGQPYTRSRYYHLYLDGQYWGVYQTQERSEARYAASYFGGSSEDYDVAKINAGPGAPYTIEVTDGTLDACTRLWQAASQGFSADAAYYKAQGLNPDGTVNPAYERLLDVDNVIDYMICTFYVGDLDAPISSFFQNSRPNNFYTVYNRADPDGFKFFRHDCEHTLFNVNENRTGPYPAGSQSQHFNPQWLHQQLAANAEYKTRFADHVYRHLFNDGPMTPQAAARLLTARKDTIDLAIIAESARWGDAKVARPRTKDDDWLPQVNFLLNDYFPQRTSIVLNQLKSKGWYPSTDAPTFNQHGGAVEAGFGIVMTAQSGDIYYTLDGEDPRLPGGAVNTAHAMLYTGPVVLTESTRVKARAFGSVWSAVHDAVFAVGPVAEGLRISEFMYHPVETGNPDDPNTEFVELTNVGAEPIQLKLVRFTNGVDFTFPNVELSPGACCLVVKNTIAFETTYGFGLPIVGEYAGSLANEGERITLVDAAGVTIQSFKYEDDWYDLTNGQGHSLISANPAGSDPEQWSQKDAWRASTESGGSPGVLDDY